MGRPILVGELNPYGSDPAYALYPYPPLSAGARLCERILGMTRRRYLDAFERFNACEGEWDAERARNFATYTLTYALARKSVVVLFGRRVYKAFATCSPVHLPKDWPKFTRQTAHLPDGDVELVVLPHPSGLCREYNTVEGRVRARVLLMEAGVEL